MRFAECFYTNYVHIIYMGVCVYLKKGLPNESIKVMSKFGARNWRRYWLKYFFAET